MHDLNHKSWKQRQSNLSATIISLYCSERTDLNKSKGILACRATYPKKLIKLCTIMDLHIQDADMNDYENTWEYKTSFGRTMVYKH